MSNEVTRLENKTYIESGQTWLRESFFNFDGAQLIERAQ